MKIEKLTENKIRIIVKQEELKDKSLDLQTIMTKAAVSQGLFLEILEKARREVGFETEGRKLLIEAFSSSDDVMVFTITRYDSPVDDKFDKTSLPPSFNPFGRSLKVKRKINMVPKSDFSAYRFDDFEAFCSFCGSLIEHSNISTYRLASSALYVYKDAYFLVLSNINLQNRSLLKFYSCLSEFGTFCTHDRRFEGRLKEYGKCIMKKNAIGLGLKFFVDKR